MMYLEFQDSGVLKNNQETEKENYLSHHRFLIDFYFSPYKDNIYDSKKFVHSHIVTVIRFDTSDSCAIS